MAKKRAVSEGLPGDLFKPDMDGSQAEDQLVETPFRDRILIFQKMSELKSITNKSFILAAVNGRLTLGTLQPVRSDFTDFMFFLADARYDPICLCDVKDFRLLGIFCCGIYDNRPEWNDVPEIRSDLENLF